MIIKTIRILYISIAGNTRNFVENLEDYAEDQHQKNSDQPLIELTEISDQSDFADEKSPYFVFVPTYLDGGNGIDNGVKELMTNTMGEYVAYDHNADYCMGIVGSGNRNFNIQFCLTARRYAERFDVPEIAEYELRGTDRDVSRVYQTMIKRAREYEDEQATAKK
nr:class Ib ribonucleoside-diphosphate reductase assembly flavoprotein NrdI [Fructilactobacillus fructivorans]